MTDLPIVCTLAPSDLGTRRETLIAGLVNRAEHVDAIEDGYRFRFVATGDVLPAVAQTIEAERHCCRFLKFELSVEPAGGPITLTITGPSGTHEFLSALLSTEGADNANKPARTVGTMAVNPVD
jgi:hypothetical protein